MNKTILTITFTLITIAFCNAQKIEIEKVFGGYKYYQNEKRMTFGDLARTMESNAKALKLIKKAQGNNTLSSIFGFAGGALFGWPIGTELGGGNPNWTIAGIGVGVMAIGIPLSSGANKNAREAIELYNSSLEPSSYRGFKPQFNLLSNSSGFGISMSF